MILITRNNIETQRAKRVPDSKGTIWNPLSIWLLMQMFNVCSVLCMCISFVVADIPGAIICCLTWILNLSLWNMSRSLKSISKLWHYNKLKWRQRNGYRWAALLLSPAPCPAALSLGYTSSDRTIIQCLFKGYRCSSRHLNGAVSDILTTSGRLKNESL